MSCLLEQPSQSAYPTELLHPVDMYTSESDTCSSFPATENETQVCFFCILCVPYMPLPSSSAHRVGAFAAQQALSLLSARQHIQPANRTLASSCAFT